MADLSGQLTFIEILGEGDVSGVQVGLLWHLTFVIGWVTVGDWWLFYNGPLTIIPYLEVLISKRS